jgi:hypothetical protein
MKLRSNKITPKSCKPKKPYSELCLLFLDFIIQSLPMPCVSMDLGILNRHIPMVPKNDLDWAAISQAQPSFAENLGNGTTAK